PSNPRSNRIWTCPRTLAVGREPQRASLAKPFCVRSVAFAQIYRAIVIDRAAILIKEEHLPIGGEICRHRKIKPGEVTFFLRTGCQRDHCGPRPAELQENLPVAENVMNPRIHGHRKKCSLLARRSDAKQIWEDTFA